MKSTIECGCSVADWKKNKSDLTCLLVLQNKKKTVLPSDSDKVLKKIVKNGCFNGGNGESIVFYPSVTSGCSHYCSTAVAVCGCGSLEDGVDYESDQWRKCGGEISKIAKKQKAKKICVVLPENIENPSVMQWVTEGIILGEYEFEKYKEKKEKDTYDGIAKVVFSVKKQKQSYRKKLSNGVNGAYAACSARNMANEPGNHWTAASFASYAKKLAGKTDLKCTVLGKGEMQKLKMGGILAVNQGSAEPPKLIVLEHEPESYSQTVLLVGKGLTFDSGGISLKPASGMQDMKFDMCGGAAVLCAMQAIAQEKPKVRVVALIPSTDNVIGSNALKPGDIIRHFNGVTSEIINTDAEGRLILADALAYGCEKYEPDCVIDLATLTGAVVVGLGHHYTGLLSNSDVLADKIIKAGKVTAEPVWRLPLDKEFTKQIKSDVADIKNTGGRAGGTCTAAAYLEKFVGNTPWAHLDIAGTAWSFTKKSYISKGASGTGVRTLVEFIRSWKKTKF